MRLPGRVLTPLSRCSLAALRPQLLAASSSVDRNRVHSARQGLYCSASIRRLSDRNSSHTTSAESSEADCLELLERNDELSSEEARVEFGWIVAHLRDEAETAGRVRGSASEEYEKLKGYCARRGSGEPLQYILGSVDFGPLTLLTRAPVFIPRPETAYVIDLLAEHIASTLPSRPTNRPLRILDMCTGSGSLALLLAHRLSPRIHVTGIDINPEAVALSQENAQFNGLKEHVEFKVQDVFNLHEAASYDMIVSNPPYIPRKEWDGLAKSVKDHEDPRALIGNSGDLPTATATQGGVDTSSAVGDDRKGLDFYRKIASLIPSLRAPTIPGLPLAAVEIGPTQADDVRGLFESRANGRTVSTQVWQDQFGQDRMVLAFGK